MRIYIHIGMHKTGTTSVQRAISSNSNKLESIGYRVFVNLPQMNAKNIEYFDPAWLRQQIGMAERDGLQAIIFSAEMISTFNSTQLNSLIEVFYGCEVTFVSCFRHWNSFLPSRWAQNCSRRDTQSFPAYLKNLQLHEEKHIDAHFDLVVERMIAAKVNNIRVISYDNATIIDRLLPTCLSAFDLPQVFVDGFQNTKKKYNIRNSSQSTELIRLFNGLYSLRYSLGYNELFLGILQATPVKNIYDFSVKVSNVMNKHEELQKQLIDILNKKRVVVTLTQKDNSIAKWEKMMEIVTNELIVNPYHSRMFGNIPDSDIVCSKVEVDDLSTGIQEKMASAFGNC